MATLTLGSAGKNVYFPGAPLAIVAGDDPIVLTKWCVELRRAGCRVKEAYSAEEALASCMAEWPSTVIIDSCLPDMTGIQLASKINSMEYVPIVLLSASLDNRMVADALDAGAYLFIGKPLDSQSLILIVQSALHAAGGLRQSWCEARGLRWTASSPEDQVSIATGLLMERLNLPYTEAFGLLRKHSRRQRRKLAELASELLRSVDRCNELLSAISATSPGPSQSSSVSTGPKERTPQ